MSMDYRGVVKKEDKYWFGNSQVRLPDPLSAILMSTEITDTCWLWKGATTKQGYGRIMALGKERPVHRWMYEIFYGPIDPNLVCCHKCDVRNCLRPDHVFIGTRDDNQKDMKAKGRAASRERNGMAKLNSEHVEEIKSAKGKFTQRELGKFYGVSQQHISLIQRDLTWKGKP